MVLSVTVEFLKFSLHAPLSFIIILIIYWKILCVFVEKDNKMWPEQKIQNQKEYFAAQRKRPTGNLTEYVVRTYYCIYKGCSIYKSDSCPAREVSNYKIKNIVYEGFYNNRPDHDYNSVINDCKNYLMNMGYIHLEQRDGDEFIFIDKPLDFLNPGEHETYLKKYNIQETFEAQNQFDVDIHPVHNENALSALLYHMADPEHFPDPYEEIQAPDTDSSSFLSCDICDGHYVIRHGKNGSFFGCSNYPRCKSTKTIADQTYSWFAQHGLNIYEVEVPCWKCGKSIQLRSYFPQIDLSKDQPELARKLDLSIIRLGTINTLDQYLSAKHKDIYMGYSKQFNGEYMANHCPHCQSLQGTNRAVESMYKLLIDALKGYALPACIAETLTVTETSLSKREWKDVITKVLKYQG